MKTKSLIKSTLIVSIFVIFLKILGFIKQSVIANYFGAWREKEISDYSWFNPLIEVTFEGRKVWIPNNYDAYLTKLYGDYMTPPPIEKRKSHHSHYFIDLTRRYTLEEIREMGY